ncbi:XRE family transcriptional regulator [Loigolactobacillus bifermentans]|jgi:Zn-dependent peptidase ImmA (M78 family)|uniref:DNA-binding helix-turn-helix protein n=1 Tax=Loigolactobacillus bifermentans DSM 20003 TaxID=1423726 RepID=A0A0R1GJZ4_9LACO|nr:XRE family transcriptional regulator [Loigolactobacillus bifermentans]KRK34365.1 DNA-binding helix-turn-helix protein [Loigolactobacillus bifermentans DSM 20003]QGG60067.1 ImmA/IrrE family metallo-endopeptidase [Loigolactobacillus bifermentans]
MAVISMSRGFNPKKLLYLRELNDVTLKQVAESTFLSVQYISQFEHGDRRPNFEQIIRLANFFNVEHTFFLNDVSIPENTGATFYRKLQKVPKKKYVQAERQTKWFSIVDQLLSTELRVGHGQLPDFANKSNHVEMLDEQYIEDMATSVRKHFKFGVGPIRNVTLLVERLGIRVQFSDLSSEHIDALTDQLDNHFYITVNTSRRPSVRIRFDLAHELGHILLHSHYPQSEVSKKANHKFIEAEANHFAGALLMPAEGLAMDMAATNMEYLVSLKRHWKVSIQAMIYRGCQIGLITDQQALFLRQTIARKGWRVSEPYDDSIEVEQPSFLRSALEYKATNSEELIDYVYHIIGRKKDSELKLVK